jgi:hypothetical protein
VTTTTHRVRQRPPLRALGLAAALVLVGIVLLLMADLIDREVALTTTGVVVVVLGLGLFVASWLVARSMRVQVVLDEAGYRLEGAIRPDGGTWSGITRVTQGSDRLTMLRKDGSRLQLVVARGSRADLDALSADIAARLDDDRGYTQH